MTDQTATERDFFTDRSVLLDPYSWLDESRAKGRVRKLDSRDVFMVTGFAEASEVLLNNDDFRPPLPPRARLRRYHSSHEAATSPTRLPSIITSLSVPSR